MLRPMNFEMKVYKMRKSFGEGSQHSRPLCHIELKPTMVHGSPKEKANRALKNLVLEPCAELYILAVDS